MFILGKNLTTWQRQQSNADLDELVMGAEAFYAIAKELQRRSKVML